MKNLYKKQGFAAILFLVLFTTSTFSQKPSIFFDPGSLQETVVPGGSAVVHSVLRNNTEDTVEFYFPGYTSRDLGGPDSFGYSWIDSDEPGGPDWAWNDISETGILVQGLGDDLVAGPFEMDIDFVYYGEPRSQFWISSNGCISFNEQIIPYANDPIPTNNNYIDFIAWFWDDLTIDSGLTSVYFKNFEEKTIVQFNKMVHYPGTESFITAQVLFVNNGTIFIRYKQVHGEFETNSATIGLQSWNSQVGLQVAYNQEYVHSELAIRFDHTTNFITHVEPASLYLPPATQETIWVTYSAEGYESGIYEQDLKCITNHPEYPHVVLHNKMIVSNPVNAGFKGYVTDAATGFALDDVLVKVGEHQAYTNDNGYYELMLEAGEYDVKFMKNGYQTLIVEDTTALAGFSILDVELEGFYFLAGRVFAGEYNIDEGFAYWYKMIEGDVVDIGAEMTGEMGWYEFSGLASAGYIIKAEPGPGSEYYGSFMPTYYGDVLHWEEATLLTVPPSSESAHIHLVAAVNAPEGPGSVSGTIEVSNRAEGIPVVLKTADPGSVQMTYSASDGTYNFSYLAYGTYEIFAEIPGKSITPQIITLDETHPSIEGIDMMVLENEIVFLGISESEMFESIPVIYPNPVKDKATITINLTKDSPVDVTVFEPSGRIVTNEILMINGQDNIILNLSGLSKGIYFVKMKAGSDVVLLKLFKN